MSGESSKAPAEVPTPLAKTEAERSLLQSPSVAGAAGLVGPITYLDESDGFGRHPSMRYGPPPPDDWKAYWDRKRHEREREWYYDYAGPAREYHEPPGPGGRTSAPPGLYRSGSQRRGPAVVYRVPRNSYQPERGAIERTSLEPDRSGPPKGPPSKPEVEEYDDSEDEIVTYGGQRLRSSAGVRGGGGGPPSTSPAMDVMSLRLPFMGWLNTTAKGHFVATLGEFIGTTMFLLFAFAGTQVANIDSTSNTTNTTTNASTGFSPQVLLYIALCFGFSLMVNVWIFFRISGGLFNPAVTLAMVLTNAMGVGRALLLVCAQMIGSIFASFLVDVLFPTKFNVRTTLGSGTSLVSGVFIEAILTAELVFTIFMLAKEKHKATFIAPVGIGLALFISELVGVYYTGGSLNPARSFGPCVVTGTFDKEHWIYWVGPAAGSVAAVMFYKLIKILEYEIANPGQDGDSETPSKIADQQLKTERSPGSMV